MPYATKMSICKMQLVQSGCSVSWVTLNSYSDSSEGDTVTQIGKQLCDVWSLKATHWWMQKVRWLQGAHLGYTFLVSIMDQFWFFFFSSWLCLENIYCMNSFIRKNQLDICPKQEIKKSLLFSIQLYSILVHWNESQPLNTFSRYFLLNQTGYEHSGYGDILFGDDKVTSKDTESALRCLMVCKS